MTREIATKLVKQLETMVFFQKDCLDRGDWDDYDKVSEKIMKIREKIVSSSAKED